MSDKIVQCNVTKNESEEVVKYEFLYEVENPEDTTSKNTFCSVVTAEEMTDPDSETEAKAKANIKAAAIKSAWLDSLEPTTAEPVESVVGDVTL